MFIITLQDGTKIAADKIDRRDYVSGFDFLEEDSGQWRYVSLSNVKSITISAYYANGGK